MLSVAIVNVFFECHVVLVTVYINRSFYVLAL